MKYFTFFLLNVGLASFFSCQKSSSEAMISNSTQSTPTSLYTIPGISVIDDVMYGRYLCIDSFMSLHYLENQLQNNPDHIRIAWEQALGFYSRETIRTNRMSFLVDTLRILEQDLEKNDELYHELWTEYREIQYLQSMTRELDKFVNDQGYVKFCGQLWLIRDTLSYKVLPGGVNEPCHTFTYHAQHACHKSKKRSYDIQHYEDMDSTYYLSCFDRKLDAWLINYESVWGYHYAKIYLDHDYIVCLNGRWMPFDASLLRLTPRIVYEQSNAIYSVDANSYSRQGVSRLSYTFAHGYDPVCIQAADIECSVTNDVLTPAKLETTIWIP